MQAQVAGRDGVQHDQEDIGRPRRRQWASVLAHLVDPAAHPERSSQDRRDRDGRRETDQNEAPETSARAPDERNEPRGHPERHE